MQPRTGFSPQQTKTLHEIREEPAFGESLAALAISHKRLDDAIEGVCFGLSHQPEVYPVVPGTALRVVKTPALPNAPSLRIFFTIEEDVISLVEVDFCEESVLPELSYEE